MRSPRMPKNGEKSEPTHASAAKATRYWTEPVAVSTYQPRISASISNASDVAKSAGHWKRKLATRKGARAGLRGRGRLRSAQELTPRHFFQGSGGSPGTRGATGCGCFFGFFFSRLLRCCPFGMAVL